MDFLILQHVKIEPPNLIGEVLHDAGHSLHTLHLNCGDALPADTRDFSGVVIMGGPQSANDTHLDYIRDELAWIAERIREGMPMLGICLGAQMMAKAAGGSVSTSPQREVGWYPVYPTRDAVSDPLFSSLPARGLTMFQWHGETFSLPKGATLLATHAKVPGQAFRLGRAQYGMQFHCEVDAPLIEKWLAAGDSECAWLGEAGIRKLREEIPQFLDPMRAYCRQMTLNWLKLFS
jgi:GMP synthase (glutamine-hydrolysing)